MTNDQTSRTHTCIALGPSGNRQVLLKCFDLKMGKVVIWRTFEELPMTDRIVKVTNLWGNLSRKQMKKNKIEFLNRIGEKFDWDNENIDEREGIVE